MGKYLLTYEKKLIMSNKSKPEGPYIAKLEANTFHDATKKAIPLLATIGMMSDFHDVWNAKLTDSKNIEYIILNEGSWTVDMETGKPTN